MQRQTIDKLCVWGSYLVIGAATVLFFVNRRQILMVLLLLAISIYLRALMYRIRCKGLEEENEQLKSDLRRLSKLLPRSGQAGETKG